MSDPLIDKNWYSSEAQKADREAATLVLHKMKALEVKFGITRRKVIEKTPFGVRIRYVEKKIGYGF